MSIRLVSTKPIQVNCLVFLLNVVAFRLRKRWEILKREVREREKRMADLAVIAMLLNASKYF